MKWEYRVLLTPVQLDERELNVLGADGWELVSIIQPSYLTQAPRMVEPKHINCVFKRPKP